MPVSSTPDRTAAGNTARSRTARIVVTTVVGILVVSAVDEMIFANRIFPGVRAGPVDVGWMTPGAASQELSRRLETTAAVTLVWTSGHKAARFSAVDLGIDSDQAANAAYVLGRTASLPERFAQRTRASVAGVSLRLRPRPVKRVRSVLASVAGAVARPATDARFALRGGKLAIIPSRPGVKINSMRTITRLANAVLSGRKTMVVPLVPVAPKATTAQADALAPTAARWVAKPVRPKAGRQLLSWTPAQILQLMTIQNNQLAVSTRALAAKLSPVGRNLNSPPEDARFNVISNRVRIVGGHAGRAVDVADTARRLTAALDSKSRYLSVAMRPVAPSTTRRDLADLGIRTMLSSFTTRFRLGADGRDTNINLAARAVRGKVLAPGQVFSLNKATGPRNIRTGYKEALVFSNGKVVPGIGGGVCQVSSTLYQTALLANLRITARSNHSMAVTYLPPGRDATALYPMIDLQFENTTGRPILLWSAATGNRLTMQIYGEARRYDVRIETRVRRFGASKTRTVFDPTLPPGDRVVQVEGRPGYVATAFRIVRQGKRVVRREYLSTDRYRPRDWVIRVGP